MAIINSAAVNTEVYIYHLKLRVFSRYISRRGTELSSYSLILRKKKKKRPKISVRKKQAENLDRHFSKEDGERAYEKMPKIADY